MSAIERIELAERLITRRRFLVGAGALVLAGCGTPEEAVVPTATVATTRTVATPRGPVNIPTTPQRIATIFPPDLANALALGLPIVAGPGLGGASTNAPFPTYLVDAFGTQLNRVTKSTAYPPNLEQLAALQPDVILATLFAGEPDTQLFDGLDAIAPTVTYEYTGGGDRAAITWQLMLRQIGTLFGRESAAEEYIAAFEARAAALRERLASRWGGKTYTIIEHYVDQPWVYGSAGAHMARTLQDELGLQLSPSVDQIVTEMGDAFGASISYERIDAIDADVIFMVVRSTAEGTADRSGPEVPVGQALWDRLPAVRAGQVHEITNDILFESGPSALAFLGVVEQALVA